MEESCSGGAGLTVTMIDFSETFARILGSVTRTEACTTTLLQRIRSELDFARQFAELHPEQRAEWEESMLGAVEFMSNSLSPGGSVDLTSIVQETESMLSSIGEAAKEYTIHCCGHAHIDMSWAWPSAVF